MRRHALQPEPTASSNVFVLASCGDLAPPGSQSFSAVHRLVADLLQARPQADDGLLYSVRIFIDDGDCLDRCDVVMAGLAERVGPMRGALGCSSSTRDNSPAEHALWRGPPDAV